MTETAIYGLSCAFCGYVLAMLVTNITQWRKNVAAYIKLEEAKQADSLWFKELKKGETV